MSKRHDLHRERRSLLDWDRCRTGFGRRWPNEIGKLAQPERIWTSGLRSLVVPLDGSVMAEHSLPSALAIARRSGASVRLVHVYSALDSLNPWQPLYDYNQQSMELRRRRKEEYMQSVMRRIGRRDDVELVSVVIDGDDIAESLCQAAVGSDLVVMASHGRGFLGRLLHGSVTHSLTRMLPCPLLHVRGEGTAVEWMDDPLPRHVLIPLDGTKLSERIIEYAAAIGSLGQVKCTLTHFQDLEHTCRRNALVDAHSYLHEAAGRLRERLPHVTAEVVVSDQRIATEILLLVEEQGIDLIALTTHGRTGLKRLLRGSVADEVLQRAKTPVLVFRPAVQKPR